MLVVLIGIIVSVFLAGCNSGAPTAGSYHLGQYNTTLDPNESVLAAKVAKYVSMIRLNPAQLKKMTLPELREVQKLMAAASLQMNQENQQIKILNCLYCEKIQEISGKCKVALPIIPTSSSAIPTTCNSCSGFVNSTIDPNYAKIQNHKIKVSLSLGNGGAGDYYLEANEVYKSSKFGPSTDEGTVVTFSSLGGAAANPPAWTGLTSLYVKQSNGKAMPAAADFSMSISIDGNPIVESSSIGYPTGSSFLNKDGKAIALEVDLASIFSVSQTQGICHPIPSFYSTAQYQAKQSVANAAKGASFYAPTGVDKAGIISDLVTSSKKLIGEKNTFTIEQNTNGRLQAALQAGAANGCVAGLDIKTVEFSLAGSVPGSTLITSDAGSAFPQVNPAQAGILQFTLGENLVFSGESFGSGEQFLFGTIVPNSRRGQDRWS